MFRVFSSRAVIGLGPVLTTLDTSNVEFIESAEVLWSPAISLSPKVNNMQGYYRLNTTILSDTYKYLNYMFRPLWP